MTVTRHPVASRAEAVELLQRHDIMPTEQRVNIAAFLFQKPQHLSAEDILAGVNGGRERVSKATVYNTLGLFVRKGLLREVLIDPERVFYDSNTSVHYHVYDMDSGVLSDVDPATIDIAALPEPPPGTEVDSLDVIIRVRAKR